MSDGGSTAQWLDPGSARLECRGVVESRSVSSATRDCRRGSGTYDCCTRPAVRMARTSNGEKWPNGLVPCCTPRQHSVPSPRRNRLVVSRGQMKSRLPIPTWRSRRREVWTTRASTPSRLYCPTPRMPSRSAGQRCGLATGPCRALSLQRALVCACQGGSTPSLRGPFAGLPLLASELGGGRPFLQTPNHWWPADRSWFVATEVDFDSTVIGCSEELSRAVMDHPDLECLSVSPEDDLAHGDQLNWTQRSGRPGPDGPSRAG
jgi:hypothetical protein